jgi:hypothetical protein
MPQMGISRVRDLCDKNYVPPLHFIDKKKIINTNHAVPKKTQKF